MGQRKDGGRVAGGATRRQVIAGAAAVVGGLAVGLREAAAEKEEGVRRGAEWIHQEVRFRASRVAIYEALTIGSQFDKVGALSAAMKAGIPPGSPPTSISAEAGGPFALFGGYVSGRQVELVAPSRVVQAWRAGSWPPGVYSIARFELSEQGTGTLLVFDHTGFPDGQGKHLAAGWKANYWVPLASLPA